MFVTTIGQRMLILTAYAHRKMGHSGTLSHLRPDVFSAKSEKCMSPSHAGVCVLP